jgi:hypothetical protein
VSGVPGWCRRGQKVVCRVGKGHWNVLQLDDRGLAIAFPVVGLVYTVSGVEVAPDGWIGLELVELEADCRFGHRGFSPAVEDDTEAALFRASHPSSGAPRHLLPQGEKEGVGR